MSKKVLITSRSLVREVAEAMQLLKDSGLELVVSIRDVPWRENDLLTMVADVEGTIAGLDLYTARVIEAAPKLKVIARNGIGVDTVDVEAASRKGVYVTNAGSAPAASVADLTMGMIINLARHIVAALSDTRQGNWKRRVGHQLAGQTLGVVGTGNIGRQVVSRAQSFGMEVIAFDVFRNEEWAQAASVDYLMLEELLRTADYVTLHVPLVKGTRGLIGREHLALMKPSAYLINTARGGIVDEKALYDVICEGGIAGAALDVLEQEPPTDSPLLGLPNVLVTPHLGSATKESTAAACMIAARNVVAVLGGEDPISAVNYAAVKAMEKGC